MSWLSMKVTAYCLGDPVNKPAGFYLGTAASFCWCIDIHRAYHKNILKTTWPNEPTMKQQGGIVALRKINKKRANCTLFSVSQTSDFPPLFSPCGGSQPMRPEGLPSRSLKRQNCVRRQASCKMPLVVKSKAWRWADGWKRCDRKY